MYQHIVVGLDGSVLAEAILPHVEALARQFGSRVTLVRATVSAEDLSRDMASRVTAMAGAGAIVDPTPIQEADTREAEEYLQSVVRRLARPDLQLSAEHPAGDPSRVLVERAHALGADLLALTTHGRGGLGRLFYGSVAEEVLRQAACPVLLVRVHEGHGKGE